MGVVPLVFKANGSLNQSANLSTEKLRIHAGLHAHHVHRDVEHDVCCRVRRHLNARLDSKRAYGNVLHFNLPAGMRRGAATLDGVGPANSDLCSPMVANNILFYLYHERKRLRNSRRTQGAGCLVRYPPFPPHLCEPLLRCRASGCDARLAALPPPYSGERASRPRFISAPDT